MKAKNNLLSILLAARESVDIEREKSIISVFSFLIRQSVFYSLLCLVLIFSAPVYGDTIPIKLHPVNSHYFEFRGEPTILITSAEQYSAVQNLDFDYVPYLEELEDNGLNYTRLFCGMYINGTAAELPRMNGGQVYMPIGSPLYPDTINAALTKGLVTPWARSDSAGYWDGGNKFDLDTWDALYFSRLVDFVDKASQKGIVVEVTFFCGYGGAKYWQFSPMNYINNINNVGKFGTDYGPYDTDSTNIGHLYPLTLIAAEEDSLLYYQEAMIEKHIEELKDFDNVFYEPVNEPYFVDAGATVINQNGEHCGSRVGISTEWQAHMIKVILTKIAGLSNDFLVAQNIDHFYEKAWVVDDTISPINMDDFRDIYPGVDILNFHYGARFARYIDRTVSYNYGLNRPVGQDENGYVGGEDHTYRKQGWNYIIGGGAIYNNLDLSYTTDGYEGGQPTNPSSGYGGSPELHEQYGILKEFIHDLNFINMTPNNDLPKSDGIITAIQPSVDINIRCLANVGDEYAVYVEGGSQINMTFDLPAGNYKADWINTKGRDGDGNIIIDKSEILVHAGDTVTISSPSYTEQDIALRLVAFENNPPVIDTVAKAIPDTAIIPNTVSLSVHASDSDGDTLRFLWSKASGPGTIVFSPNDSTTSNLSTASFDTAGDYTLRVDIYDMFDTVTSTVMVKVIVEDCEYPTSLSANNLMPTSAELSWTENGTATSWELMLGNQGFDTTAATPVSVTLNPYTWSGLNPDSSYDWYIRADCGNSNYSMWVGPDNFTTPGLPDDVLPFFEDWESNSGLSQTSGGMYSGTNFSWDFVTDNPDEGRVRWGTQAYLVSTGSGAVTLDKHPNDGDYAMNEIILTLDLSNYSSEDVELAFSWTDHNDEEQAEDKVWIRGNDTSPWVEIYDFDPVSHPNDIYEEISRLDIDNTLAGALPSQVVSATFQLKFVQRDNSFTPGDGISIDDIHISSPSTTVICNDPSELSTGFVAPSYAELSWIENGGATSWQIRLGEAGFDTTALTPATISDNPVTWTDLNPNTSFDWYIRAECGNGTYSSWVGPHNFSTSDVGSDVLPFNEDWESSSGMIQVNGNIYAGSSYSWEFETDNPNEGRARWGNQAFMANNGSGALTMDKFPNDGDFAINAAILTIDLSAFTQDDIEMSFYWTDHKDEEQTNDKVWVRGNNTAPWVEIFDFNPVSSPDGIFQLVAGLDVDNTLASASPPQSVSATCQIKFGQQDNSFTPGDGISIDDISITSSATVVTCHDPSSLSTLSVAPSYAELNWTENGSASAWEIRLGEAGFDTAGIVPTSASTNPHTWAGLTPNTAYDWYVRADCNFGNYSEWVGPHNFSTPDVSHDVLPFTEDWESNTGVLQSNNTIYSGNNYSWDFETDNPNEGRVRWGTNAFLASTGSGALTLDKFPNDGDFAVNCAILTIDLSAFTADDLELAFSWTDHRDEEQSEDKVWIRGNNTSQWVEIFDFNPASSPDGVFQHINALDIDNTLVSVTPQQTVSATFQVKFGQKDNSFTPGDGISIDDISITSASSVVTCDDPSDLSNSFIAPSYAECSWTENGSTTTWEIRLGEAGFDTTGAVPVSVNTNPYTWTGLDSNTSYDWYVRSVCEGGLLSDWAEPTSFTTPDINNKVLPFLEDWESSSGIIQTIGLVYSGNSYSWKFETDNPNEGRLRWGTNAYLPSAGLGAMTFDKHPNDGDFATNAAILTMDLSAYNTSDLELSFWWTDHRDEEQQEDKVWIRGNTTDQWVEIFDLDPASSIDGIYQLVDQLDIDNTLSNATPAQTVSSTFQLKFGQKDNSFTPGDGISIDDISIEEILIPKSVNFGGPLINEELFVYSHEGWLYLLCDDEVASERIDIQIIDVYGKKISDSQLPPGKKRSLYIGKMNNYFIVKIILNSKLITKKVYIN